MAKVFDKEVSEYTDEQLIAIANSFKDAFEQRLEASTHEKFKKQAFPPPNQAFLKLQQIVNDEITKRKIGQ